MIEMTPATENVFTNVVLSVMEMIRNGRTIEAVRLHLERDPMVAQSPFSIDEVMNEASFWIGKPKK